MVQQAGADVTGQVRLIRETKGMTQQEMADAAGVSLSTVRRLERDAGARFNLTTERHLERVLGFRQGGLPLLRKGTPMDEVWRKPTMFTVEPYFRYTTAPLGDIVVTSSYTAKVIAGELRDMVEHREQELALLAAGKLWAGSGQTPGQWLFEWLPWPARMSATPVWLDRFFDSCEQVAAVMVDEEVPRPLRVAEAVAIQVGFDRAWAVSTNSFFDPETGEELDDVWPGFDDIFDVVDPRPLFDRGEHADWVPAESMLHPQRWWQRVERSRSL